MLARTTWRRRYEALAFVMDQIVRKGRSPSGDDIARHLGVSDTRAKQFVNQLVAEGLGGRTPGAKRDTYIADWDRARAAVVSRLEKLGASIAQPLGAFVYHFPNGQLPLVPPFEHLPDVD